jgi:heme exporter protein A
MIRIRNLVKNFGLKRVLRGLDLEVEAGEFMIMLGPNGAGKTTLLRIIASLSRANFGEVQVGGMLLPDHADQVRRLLGYVSHQSLLYSELTAHENLRFFGRLYGVQNLQERIEVLLELVGLSDRGRDQVRTYSRGMEQRLSIARALLQDPVLLLFDEPYTGLDQDAALGLDDTLGELSTSGRTILMTSHDINRSSQLASRIDVLSRGVVAASYLRDEIDSRSLEDRYRQVTHA